MADFVMPNPGSFAPVFDASKRETKRPWYVGVPKRLSPTGAYRREYFPSKREAEERGRQLQGLDRQSHRAVVKAGPKLIETAVNYDELFRDLYGFEGGLAEACEAFMGHLDQKQNCATLGELLDAYQREGVSEWAKGTQDAWKSLRNHARELDSRPAMTLDTAFWRDWLGQKARDEGWKAASFNRMRRMLFTAYKRGIPDHVPQNPLEGVRNRKVKREAKEVYTIDQIRTLLNCAWEYDRDLVPFFAIAIFAGLRPDSELKKLKWADVDFGNRRITVAAEFDNKTGTKRFVPIHENLLAWLEPWRGAAGSVCGGLKNFLKRRRYVVRGKYQSPEGTSEKDWTELVPNGSESRDITRHTFGSYMDVATGHDRDRIREWMGHRDYRTYDQYYRNSRTEEEGKEFLEIFPPAEGQFNSS